MEYKYFIWSITIILLIRLITRYIIYINFYLSRTNAIIISLVTAIIYTIQIYNRWYRRTMIFTLVWIMITFSDLILFYMIVEASILFFVYLFTYRAYKERSVSVILIVTYILIFRVPFLVVILNILTTKVFIIKVTNTSLVVFILIMIIFICKIPVYGLHYWLLKAHSYCTTWGRVILAGIILKAGVVGFIYLYQVRYIGVDILKWYVYIGVLISRMNILFITDIKTIIAQTRVTHISFLSIRLLINRNISIKLSVIFCFIHGLIRSLIFRIAEILIVMRKSRNLIMLKQLYIIRFIFMAMVLINNSFPITPYIWCELWIFITMRWNSIGIILAIVIVIVITCNLLFFIWLTMLKHQYLIVISDFKYLYIVLSMITPLILFFIVFK